jgi:glycosyltransferase involved in cell wall biosynthesis
MHAGPLKVMVDFGLYGNSAIYCRAGWREPELTFSCTTGDVSALELPTPEEPGTYVLQFDVMPMPDEAQPDEAQPQTLKVLVNGVETGRFEVDGRAVLKCIVDRNLIEGATALSVEFHQPKAATENERDDSPPSLAFGTLVLLRVDGAAEPAGDAIVTSPPALLTAAILDRSPAPQQERWIEGRKMQDDGPQSAPTEAANGYIDLYGYSDIAHAWLVAGWTWLEPNENEGPAATAPTATVAADFRDYELSGKFPMLSSPRLDLPKGGAGFLLVLHDQPRPEIELVKLRLDLLGRTLELGPSKEVRHLTNSETTAWISSIVTDIKKSPAKSLLLLLTAGQEVDVNYYFARYSDVRSFGAKPVEHYLEIGWREGRDPNQWFCTKDYLDLYPDVIATGHNPLYHYITYGRAEGRRPNRRSHEWDIVSREFDACFYLSTNPDVARQQVEPIAHYLEHGWREHRDPAPWFANDYYLEHQWDVMQYNVNPFFHYIQFGRSQRRKPCPNRRRAYEPLVSVIVPNYNHAEFLAERLDSILEQTYQNFEILILDDASLDDSRSIIETYRQKHPARIRTIFNDANSGNVFHQWRQGLENVRGELVWVCESDDAADCNFLKHLVSYFNDPSIMLAFGRIQFIDAEGVESYWLDTYRESAKPGIWNDVKIAAADEWFRGPFAVRNVIPNVGGCIFRRQPLADAVWDEAISYRILGDWYLYAQLAGGGRLAYDPKAVSFFRLHDRNTSVQNHRQPYYWREHFQLAKFLQRRFGPPEAIWARFHRILSNLYTEVFGEDPREGLHRLIDVEEILQTPHTQKHILIAVYAFQTGGGEVFGIHLANQLVQMGHIVSVASIVDHGLLDNEGIRQMLDPRIAIYERDVIDEMGVDRFLEATGVDIVHSHYIEAEYLFLTNRHEPLTVPYIVTLHGSYEAFDRMDKPISADDLLAFLRGVDVWVYLADNNLAHLKDLPIARERIIKLPNALSITTAKFEYDRRDIGADENTLIFGIASRAVADKGWEEAIRALDLAKQRVDIRLMLVFCGDGPELERLEPIYRTDMDVKFLGFQSNIHGFFRLSDCCLLPTRFVGESFPLTLVQSLQVGTPAIATDIGEVASMLNADGRSAGILLRRREKEAFVKDLALAMVKMSDRDFYSARKEDASAIGKRYQMGDVAERYVDIYARVGQWHGVGLASTAD